MEYACKKKLTRRDLFLNEIDQLAPWALLEAQIAPFYADDTGKRGRSSIGLSRMLRLYVVQQCFGLSDEGTEDAVYDSQAITNTTSGWRTGRRSSSRWACVF